MPQTERPNILLIMTDQHRWDWLGAAGASWVNTPNLDRIARRGVRFTRCQTNCPVCAPARIGLAAGLQPGRVGSLDNQSFLPASTRTYHHRLRDAGYHVGLVGKVDLAKPDPWNGRDGARPVMFTYGFTRPVECEGKMHAGNSPRPLGPYGLWLQEQGLYERFHRDYVARGRTGWVKHASHDSVLPTEAFEECYIGRRAVEWLDTADDTYPWYLLVSFVGPHDPFDPPSEYARRYRSAEAPPAVPHDPAGKPAWVTRRNLGLEPEEVAVTRRQYSAIVECIDEQIGRILDGVERRGQLDNTFVLFTSDHGEMLGDHGCYTKSVAYEGSVHVPLLTAGPGIDAGRSNDALVELIDVNPTICELAGLGPQENIDARSFAPILRGEDEAHRREAVSAIRNWRLIRTERYKYIENYNDIVELYDLVEDPGERKNIASDAPDTARELRGRMAKRFREGRWRR
ncbi:MAG: sulfatase [Planctomycetota bacterium]